MTHKLLKEYVSLLLKEKKTISDASNENLGLFVADFDIEMTLVLYDTTSIAEDYQNLIDTGAIENSWDSSSVLMNSFKGAIGLNKVPDSDAPSYDASEVVFSGAEKGYGPLMYDIAMQYCGKLMSDRHEVSKSAMGVWNYYFDNRSDVKHYKLDDYQHPKTRNKFDDAVVYQFGDKDNPLNYAYELKSNVNVSKLLANSKAVEEKCDKRFFSKMQDASLAYFRKRYNNQ